MPRPRPAAAQLLATSAVLAFGLAPAGVGSRAREALRSDAPGPADYDRMERGYYEGLVDAGRRPAELEPPPRHASARPDAVPFEAGPLALEVADVREYVLKPGLSTEHWGVRWTTNRLGMRDRDYVASRPPGTIRVAVTGDSIAAGWGVDDGRGFEPTLEAAWDSRSRAAGGAGVEIWNFAVPGHSPGARWEHVRRVGLSSGPDLLLCEATLADNGWDERRLRTLLPRGVGWDCPLYAAALDRAGARPGGDADEYKRRLRPLRRAILAGIYAAMVSDCRARGIASAWVLIPRVGKVDDPAGRRALVELARESGFDAVVDLHDVYDGADAAALAIGPSDYHPNADGHARLARRLDLALWDHPELTCLRPAAHRAGGDR